MIAFLALRERILILHPLHAQLVLLENTQLSKDPLHVQTVLLVNIVRCLGALHHLHAHLASHLRILYQELRRVHIRGIHALQELTFLVVVVTLVR